MTYEYGIAHVSSPTERHRGPMTYAEAYNWLEEWRAKSGFPGTFVMIRRPLRTGWERAL